MGGATVGLSLAQKGMRVLFCEKGRSRLAHESALLGAYPEQSALAQRSSRDLLEALAAAGRCRDPWLDVTDNRRRRFVPFIGSGTGGSSALYGMALERFHPIDFVPRDKHADAGGSDLPPAWPISYAELAPYYEQAERLFRVRGDRDPLRPDEVTGYVGPAPALGSAGSEVWRFLEKNGMHPYRLPLACESVAGCLGCQGFLCPRPCKNDSARACLVPALSRHDAVLLDECVVESLEADATRVTAARVRRRGGEMVLRADVFILAAGALESPRILLRSRSTAWPQGLANRSGLVGRNLMRHFVDLWVVETEASVDPDAGTKELAFNDFYGASGASLGSVQSFGRMPPAAVVLGEKLLSAGRSRKAIAASFRVATPVVERVMKRMFSRGVVLASIVEDLPYRENGVHPADGASDIATLSYRLHPEARGRIETMRARMKTLLQPCRPRLLRQAENNQRLAHVCGTCRFGATPEDSVLDPSNRAHGVDNLYVADASFFPSSGGTNPGLTIAANALRVADLIASGPHSGSGG